MSELLKRLALCLGFFAISANAEIRRVYWPPFPTSNFSSSTMAGQLWNLDIRFDPVTNFFYVWTNFSRVGGMLPDGFHLVVNDGPNPRGFAGEFAIFYFDAKNFADPKLTVYGYNGLNASVYRNGWTQTSWQDGSPAAGNQAADFILSSITDRTWVYQMYAIDFPNGSRSLGFAIDATRINNRTPLYPTAGVPWRGARIGANAGIWLGVDSWITTVYGANGALHDFFIEKLGYYDSSNHPTIHEPPPVCKNTNLVSTTLDVGQPFSTTITASDPQNQNIYTVTYSGQPAGAAITPASGTVLNTSSTASATINFTPNNSHAGQNYVVNFKFTDIFSASVICPLEITVRGGNISPNCNAQAFAGQYQNQSCTQTNKTISLSSTSSDPDNRPSPLTYNWSTNCPGGSFSSAVIANPQFTFNTESSPGVPTNCQVFLNVNDGLASQSCSAPVSASGCTRDCMGTIGGNMVIDLCGVCGGNSSTCRDCAGVPNGPNRYDMCGICNGSNACMDCRGIPFGGAVRDQCGVCAGNNSCIDCRGIPYGGAVKDKCNVCAGNNACVDCKGVPFGGAVYDKCGVCGGNGNCGNPSCTPEDISGQILALDQGTVAMLNIVRQAAGKLKRLRGGKLKPNEQADLAKAIKDHNDAWQAINKLPKVVIECSNPGPTCTTFNYASEIGVYSASSNDLEAIAVRFDNAIATVLRSKTNVLNPKTGNYDKKAARRNQANQTEAAATPSSSTVCQ